MHGLPTADEQSQFARYAESLSARASRVREAETLRDAVAFARGNNLMLPCPDLASSEHAVSLLKFAIPFLEEYA